MSDNFYDERIMRAKAESEFRNTIIEENIPLVISTVSNVLNRYIETENSEEFSTGLLALNEAIDRYEPSKGKFSTFAVLVIKSRVRDDLRKRSHKKEFSIEDHYEEVHSIPTKDTDLKYDIMDLKTELAKFGITFEMLTEKSPKHRDTRSNAIDLSKRISSNEIIVSELYKKLRLPITKVVRTFKVTKKFVSSNKIFITTVVIIFKNRYTDLVNWINEL